ncbi:hypothetical protein HKBW3S33_02410, partial [Candidatus Hakubella thermalkaliphila]
LLCIVQQVTEPWCMCQHKAFQFIVLQNRHQYSHRPAIFSNDNRPSLALFQDLGEVGRKNQGQVAFFLDNRILRHLPGQGLAFPGCFHLKGVHFIQLPEDGCRLRPPVLVDSQESDLVLVLPAPLGPSRPKVSPS